MSHRLQVTSYKLYENMDFKVYNQQAKEVSKTELPEEIFNVEINTDLLHQAVVAQKANNRKVVAHAKDRSEVRGGGRKPWPQKGTGRARHGSIRSPIWVGGGVTFGPLKERNYSKKINKKMKRKALFMGLSSKAKDETLILMDKLELKQPKTKDIKQIFDNLKTKLELDLNKGVLLVLPENDQKVVMAANNLSKMDTIQANSLNLVDVLSYKYLLMPKDAIETIKNTYLRDK